MLPSKKDPKEFETSRLFDLKGKTALITGASGALGTAVARGLAVNQVNLVLSSVEEEALHRLAEELQGFGISVLPVYCDVTDEAQVEQLVESAAEQFGTINILVTCAGIAHREILLEQSLEDWRKVMDINVQGTLLCC